ncbi:MAG: stimulus-sensing domain-containing protein [Rhodospirillaceae bacterium]|nr:stimulus-sensing domain-containing protein [Rhodospirillaceae bacterium]
MQADTTSTHLRAPDDLAPPDRRGSNGSAPPRKRAAPGEEDTRKRPPKGRRGKAAKAPETQDEDLDSLIEQAGLPRRRGRFISKLTLRVLAINSLALVLLVGGLLYLGQYEQRLIQSELESLLTEGTIISGAIAEGATVGGIDELPLLDIGEARQMLRRLHETTATRARLFSVADGSLIADSRMLSGPGGAVEIQPLAMPTEEPWYRRMFDSVYDWVTDMLPSRKQWPAYREEAEQNANDYTVVRRALSGSPSRQIWTVGHDRMLLGVAVPVQRLRVVIGAVLLTRDDTAIADSLRTLRTEIVGVFLIALSITVLLSLYLSGTITRPIRRLALAADAVRHGQARHTAIPDFTRRRDEIGELSGALREMTAALWARMDAIERFAADVAHEIKNPLTSLRSAVETTARVTNPDQQRRLMAIILKDVQRLDRLITDISDASRLDAELSRARGEPVDVRAVVEMLYELYQATGEDRDGPLFALTIATGGPYVVSGLESRLVQVFRNLITNAVTFSPQDGVIALALRREGRMVEVTITDDGPGIPPAKLDAIFDRFYTERPAGEDFGNHSGLGLAISKQIIVAHEGRIFARNRTEKTGAVFHVQLPAQASPSGTRRHD